MVSTPATVASHPQPAPMAYDQMTGEKKTKVWLMDGSAWYLDAT
jgi:hypothetical protein